MPVLRCMITAIVLVLGAATARAQSSEAIRLFEEGRKLAAAGDHATACQKFARSFELSPTAGIEANLADCNEHLGHLRRAWQLFRSAAAKWERDGERRKADVVLKRADGVAARATTVVLAVPEPDLEGLEILLNGEAVPPTREVIEVVDPGDVVVLATAPGYLKFQRSRPGKPGEIIKLALALRTGVAEAAPSVPVRRRSRVYLALGLGTASGATLITAGVFAVVGKQNYADAEAIKCEPETRCVADRKRQLASAEALADNGTKIAIAGGVLGVAAAVIYFTAPRDVKVAPVVTAGGGGLSFSARF